MNAGIADILKDRITLPYIDRLAGLVKTIEEEGRTREDQPFRFRYPVACTVSDPECGPSDLRDLVPDSTKKSIMYFEEIQGARSIGDHTISKWESIIRLVGWFNLDELGKTECFVSQEIVPEILTLIPVRAFLGSTPPFYNLCITEIKSTIKDFNVFSRYDYTKDLMKHLGRSDWFGLDIKVVFMTGDCVAPFSPGIPVC